MLEYVVFTEQQRLCIVGLQDTPFGPIPIAVGTDIGEEVPNGFVDLSKTHSQPVEKAIDTIKGNMLQQLDKKKIKIASEQMVRRSRAGDQNAMATLTMIADKARKGNGRAIFAFECCRVYMEAHPMQLSTDGFEIKVPEIVDTVGSDWGNRDVITQRPPKPSNSPNWQWQKDTMIGQHNPGGGRWAWTAPGKSEGIFTKIGKGFAKTFGYAGRETAKTGKALHIPGSASLDAALDITDGKNVLLSLAKSGSGETENIKEVATNPETWQQIAANWPGIGTAAAAAIATAIAVGRGQSLKNVALAAARASLPGQPGSQTVFDAAVGMMNGDRIDEAAMNAARNQIPSAQGRAAWDTAVKLVKKEKVDTKDIVNIIPGTTENSRKALTAAVEIGRGKNVKDSILAELRNSFNKSDQVYFDIGVGLASDKKVSDIVIETTEKQITTVVGKKAFRTGVDAMKRQRINPNGVANNLSKMTGHAASPERYAASVTTLTSKIEPRNAAVVLSVGKKIDIDVLDSTRAAQGENAEYFNYGYKNSGESKLVFQYAETLKGNPEALKALRAGFILGMAKRIQMVIEGAPLNVLSDVIAWELGE